MNLLPTQDRLIVEPLGLQTESSLDLSKLDDKFPKRVRVLAKGPKVCDSVQIGAELIVSPHAGQVAKVDGQDVTFIREADIRAVVET